MKRKPYYTTLFRVVGDQLWAVRDDECDDDAIWRRVSAEEYKSYRELGYRVRCNGRNTTKGTTA